MSRLNFISRFKAGAFATDKIHPFIDQALNDTDEYVRVEAARHPNATKEHLDKALSDTVWIVRDDAINNLRYKEYYPNGH